jgi:hypothetical protein
MYIEEGTKHLELFVRGPNVRCLNMLTDDGLQRNHDERRRVIQMTIIKVPIIIGIQYKCS